MSKLRSYAPMRRQSEKVKAGAGAFAAVYRQVDERSEGRCEVITVSVSEPRVPLGGGRCPRRATQHHHLFKPRRSRHAAGEVIHACAGCHDRMEWPYQRGRLCYMGAVTVAGVLEFYFQVRYSSDKFTNRGQG